MSDTQVTSLPDKQENIELKKAQAPDSSVAPVATAQPKSAFAASLEQALGEPSPDTQHPENVLHPKLHRTVGNKIYDWGIYTTFAWAGVAAVSLLSAHEAMHGRNPHFNWLRSLNNNVQKGMEGFIGKHFLRGAPKQTIEGWAKGTTMFVTLGLGGTTMMLPIKWLEDNRQKNAARIDNFLGTTPPHPELIAREVPQTWTSVLSGRMFAWGASYAAFLVMGPKLTDRISKGFGKKLTEAIMHVKPTANREVVRKWADIGAFDATFTMITAALTYFTSRAVARRTDHPHEEENALMTIDPATPTPLTPVFDATETEAPQKSFVETTKSTPANTSISPRKTGHSFAETLKVSADKDTHSPSVA